jgi:hypothetical protein
LFENEVKMGKIINIRDFQSEKRKENLRSLNDFMARAKRLGKEVAKEAESGLIIAQSKDLDKMIEVKINEFLLGNNLLRVDYFMCSLFIASLLSKIGYEIPESWYATDYIFKANKDDNPYVLEDGANVCFILCSLYPERCSYRSMTRASYIKIGSALYLQFYNATNEEIGYYMGHYFEHMADIANHCVKNFQETKKGLV